MLAEHLVLSLLTTVYMLPFVLLLAVSIISQEEYEVAGFVLVAVLVIAVFFRHLPDLWRALLFRWGNAVASVCGALDRDRSRFRV